MSPLWIELLVALAALGLLVLRTTGPLARVAGLAVVLAFAFAALDPVAVTFPAGEARAAAASAGDAASWFGAAARAGARASDLTIVWREPATAPLPAGPLGASARWHGTPLPLQPEDLQAALLRPAAVDRPTVLQIRAPGLAAPRAATLRLTVGGDTRHQKTVELDPARPAEFEFTPDRAGEHTVVVELTVGEHRVARTGTFVVAPAPRVLVLDPSGLCAAALRTQGLAVEAVDALPDDWHERAALVLGAPLPASQQQLVGEAVRDGFGLFVLGPGFGAAGEPLRALLPILPLPPAEPGPARGGAGESQAPPVPPVDEPPPPPKPDPPPPPADDPQQAGPVAKDPIEVDKHAIAMVLVVDRSGSMGETVVPGRTKMSYAKTSALQTARQLMEGDQVGIVTFGNKGSGRIELPLTDATDLPAVLAGIEKLAHAREMTYLLSGLQLADQLLAGSKAAVKHVVVITDGEFFTVEAMALRALANKMQTERQQTVSILSIVGMGSTGDFQRYAEEITRDGGGVFIAEPDPARVPVFVSAEVARALSRIGREPRRDGAPDPARTSPPPPSKPPEPDPPPERPPQPPPAERPPEAPIRLPVRALAPSPLLRPEPEAWPTLGGAVPSAAPLDAQVLLVAGDAGWPLLAYGNRGLGRVGAFAADLCGPAGAEFRAEPAFAARLAQWVQSVLPAEPRRDPAPLLTTVQVTPPAPSPREVAELEALAGDEAARFAADEPAVAPPVARRVHGLSSQWALGCVLGLLLLAAAERWLGARAWRNGAAG